MKELVSILPFVAIALIFWLLVIRPASRRQKAMVSLQNSLQPGMRIMLASGIFGTVRGIEEDRLTVEVAPGTAIEVARAAVSAVEEPATGPVDETGPAGQTGPAGETGPADTDSPR